MLAAFPSHPDSHEQHYHPLQEPAFAEWLPYQNCGQSHILPGQQDFITLDIMILSKPVVSSCNQLFFSDINNYQRLTHLLETRTQ